MLAFLYTFRECHEWSAAPISAGGYAACGECCIDGEPVAAPRVNRLFPPTQLQK